MTKSAEADQASSVDPVALHCPQDNFLLPFCPARLCVGSILRLALLMGPGRLPAPCGPRASSFEGASAQLSKQEFQESPCLEPSLTSLFPNIPQPVCQKLLGLPSRYIQHPNTFRHLCCYHPIASHEHFTWITSHLLTDLPPSSSVPTSAA